MLIRKLARNRSGTTLTELMITVAILSVAGLGLAGSFTFIARALQTHRARTLAINLSQEQVEVLKDKSYFSIIPTSTASYNTNFSPSIAYDPTTENQDPGVVPLGAVCFGDAVRLGGFGDDPDEALTAGKRWRRPWKSSDSLPRWRADWRRIIWPSLE